MGAGAIGAVFVGGCAGGLARHLLVTAWPAAGDAFPWAVLVVNCSGALLLGVLVVLVPDGRARQLLGPGLLGAWTTFSAIVVTADELIGGGQALLAAAYVAASAIGGLACVLAGFSAARAVRSRSW